MHRGIGKDELNSILASHPRLIGPLRGTIMAGFLSKAELEALVTGSVQTGDIADGAVTNGKVAADNKDGDAATASLRTLGAGATQAAAGDHTHA